VNASVRYAADLNSSSVLGTLALEICTSRNAEENVPHPHECSSASGVFIFLLGAIMYVNLGTQAREEEVIGYLAKTLATLFPLSSRLATRVSAKVSGVVSRRM